MQTKRRAWYVANKETAIAYSHDWYEQNKERANKNNKLWRDANPHKNKEIQQKYRNNNRERIRQANRKWQQNNKEKLYIQNTIRRGRLAKAQGHYTQKDVRKIYEDQGGLCYYCQQYTYGVFHADHYIPLKLGGSNYPENIVIACPSCNWKKNAKLPEDYVWELYYG